MNKEIEELDKQHREAKIAAYKKSFELFEPVRELEKKLKSEREKLIPATHYVSEMSCDHKENPTGVCIFPQKTRDSYPTCIYCGWDDDERK